MPGKQVDADRHQKSTINPRQGRAETHGRGTGAAFGATPVAKAPGPDMMLGLWTSWMEAHSGSAQG